MADGPWQLFIVRPGGDWEQNDCFDSLAAAATRIIAIESYPTTGLFLETHVDPLATDAETLSHLEHTGPTHRFVIRRRTQ
jgi:hypothetical protein